MEAEIPSVLSAHAPPYIGAIGLLRCVLLKAESVVMALGNAIALVGPGGKRVYPRSGSRRVAHQGD
eukprot:9443909-Pyramimonas_sp.AAC.1